MKVLLKLEASDVAQAISEYIENHSGQEIDVDVIMSENTLEPIQVEVDTSIMNSSDDSKGTTTTEKPKKRKRRTKAEIEADEKAAAEEAKADDVPPFDVDNSTEEVEETTDLTEDEPVEAATETEEKKTPVAETKRLFG